MNKLTLAEAIEVVKNALREDKEINHFGYYESWYSSIMKTILDEFDKYPPFSFGEQLTAHEIANNAADNFLNTLINQP
jgi:hypothetical protein